MVYLIDMVINMIIIIIIIIIIIASSSPPKVHRCGCVALSNS